MTPSPQILPTLGAGLELDAGPRPETLQRLLDRVKAHAGLVPDAGGLATMRRVVRQRMLRLGLSSCDEYLARLDASREGPGEMTELVALLVVQKTAFFRDRPQFELLARTVLPAMIAERRRLHLWSAGCATGEEAYSLAIALRQLGLTDEQAEVLATDIARPPLERAAAGVFEASRLEPLSAEERQHLQPLPDGRFACTAGLAQMVEFRVHNLLSLPFPSPGPAGWDVVFCRNVLIYFDRSTVREVIQRIRDVLAPGGYLFLGVSESLFELAEGFELVNAEGAFVYRHRERPGAPAHRPAAPPGRSRPAATPARFGWDGPKTDPGHVPHALPPPLAAPPRADDRDERLLHALQAADRGALEEARGWLEAALDEHPMDARLHFLRGVLLYRLGADDEALVALRRLVYLESGFAMGHFYLGLVHERLGQQDAARRAFRNASGTAGAGHALFDDPVLRAYLLPGDALAAACRLRLLRLEGIP